jgi:hypothetical protein
LKAEYASLVSGADDFETDDSFGDPELDHIPELEERRREEQRPLEEAGEGEAEGFELAEEELIEHASHGDEQSAHRILHDQGSDEEPVTVDYGEADEEYKPD